jgi:hypothetical protein
MHIFDDDEIEDIQDNDRNDMEDLNGFIIRDDG